MTLLSHKGIPAREQRDRRITAGASDGLGSLRTELVPEGRLNGLADSGVDECRVLGIEMRVERVRLIGDVGVGACLQGDEDREALHRMRESLLDGEGNDVQSGSHDSRRTGGIGSCSKNVRKVALDDRRADAGGRWRQH